MKPEIICPFNHWYPCSPRRKKSKDDDGDAYECGAGGGLFFVRNGVEESA